MAKLRKLVLGTVAVAAVGYAAYPFATLAWLAWAVRSSDAATLQTMVDWDGVREGIKEDLCDAAADAPPVHTAAQENAGASALPAFGASFIHGIAMNKVDAAVTPRALIAGAASDLPVARAASGVSVAWAAFESPTRFDVWLRTGVGAEPLRLQMDLRDGLWTIDRAWIPQSLLTAPART